MLDHCSFYQDIRLHSSPDRTTLYESIDLHSKGYRRNTQRLGHKTPTIALPHGTVSEEEELVQTLCWWRFLLDRWKNLSPAVEIFPIVHKILLQTPKTHVMHKTTKILKNNNCIKHNGHGWSKGWQKNTNFRPKTICIHQTHKTLKIQTCKQTNL